MLNFIIHWQGEVEAKKSDAKPQTIRNHLYISGNIIVL